MFDNRQNIEQIDFFLQKTDRQTDIQKERESEIKDKRKPRKERGKEG